VPALTETSTQLTDFGNPLTTGEFEDYVSEDAPGGRVDLGEKSGKDGTIVLASTGRAQFDTAGATRLTLQVTEAAF
jgi:hypothetical protein